jgi:hypothetical protein|tara:strand:+ start:5371 stop:6018 length:648 start_codon:yes stop_codon:yes gene_type:complete
MNVHTDPQRSDEWFAARRGRVTGSRASALFSKGRGGAESAALKALRVEIVAERLSSAPMTPGFVSSAMQNGVDSEPAARAAYELIYGVSIREVGFAAHDTLMAGVSVDGFIGPSLDTAQAIVEIKCPAPKAHLATILASEIPAEHMPQVIHSLWMTGAPRLIFASYCATMNTLKQALVLRSFDYDRDESVMADYDEKIRSFLASCDEVVAALTVT